MTTASRIRQSLARRRDDVFIRREFDRFGSSAQVGRILSTLVAEGMLVKLGLGVYARAKVSVLTGQPIPIAPLEVLAPKVLAKLGVRTQLGRLARMYNEGKMSQVPPGVVLDVGRRRVVRRLGFGTKVVQYERSKGKEIRRAPRSL